MTQPAVTMYNVALTRKELLFVIHAVKARLEWFAEKSKCAEDNEGIAEEIGFGNDAPVLELALRTLEAELARS